MKTYTSASEEAVMAGATSIQRELGRDAEGRRIGSVVASGGRLAELRALGWTYDPGRLAWSVEVDPDVPFVEAKVEGAGAREARWLAMLARACGHDKIGDLHADPDGPAKVAALLGVA